MSSWTEARRVRYRGYFAIRAGMVTLLPVYLERHGRTSRWTRVQRARKTVPPWGVFCCRDHASFSTGEIQEGATASPE